MMTNVMAVSENSEQYELAHYILQCKYMLDNINPAAAAATPQFFVDTNNNMQKARQILKDKLSTMSVDEYLGIYKEELMKSTASEEE